MSSASTPPTGEVRSDGGGGQASEPLPPAEGAASGWKRLWRYGPALVAPVVIWGLLVAALIQPVRGWIQGEQRYDQAAVQEWLEEARNADVTLAQLVNGYVDRGRNLLELRRQQQEKGPEAEDGNLLTR